MKSKSSSAKQRADEDSDAINHPRHYSSSAICSSCNYPIECIDITRHEDFCIGNAIKYLWRYKDKGGIEDLKKAIFYINDKINQIGS